MLKSGQLERPADRLSGVRTVELVLSRMQGVSGPLERMVTQSGLKITVGTLLHGLRPRRAHGVWW